ncbi:MAG: hypothetical protein ACRC04_00835, partial [Aeromonas veronii]
RQPFPHGARPGVSPTQRSSHALPALRPAHDKPPAAPCLHPCIISLSCLRVIASDQALPVYPAG